MKRNILVLLNLRSLPIERDSELFHSLRKGFDFVVITKNGVRHDYIPDKNQISVSTQDVESTIESIISKCQLLDASINGVVAWTDPDVEVAAMLGARLGLRTLSPEAATSVRNKATMRRCLDSVDGANPIYSAVSNEEQVKLLALDATKEYLIKPAGASGGRGIFKVDDPENPLTAYREFKNFCTPERDAVFGSYAEDAVIEECLIGSEHSVSGYVFNGKANILSITDKRGRSDMAYLSQSIVPSLLPSDQQKQITDLVIASVKKVGIDNCGFHVDLMLTSAGPRILEIGGRLGGECINSHLIPYAYGVFPYDIVLDLAFTAKHFKPDVLSEPHSRSAFVHIIPESPGKIVELTGLDLVAQHPNVNAFLQVKTKDEIVYHPKDKYNSFAVAYFIVCVPLDEDIDSCIESIIDLVSVRTEPANA